MAKKRRKNSPPTSVKSNVKKSRKYHVPFNAILDKNGNIQQTRQPPRKRTESQSSRSSTSSESLDASQLDQGHRQPAKPVFADASYETINNLLLNITLSSKPLLKIMSTVKTQVNCATAADKAILIKRLVDRSIRYVTYSEPGDKPLIYVLKGFYYLTCEEMLKILKTEEIKPIKVSYLVDNKDRPIYLVQFERNRLNSNLSALQSRHKAIGNLIVRWERFNRSQKRLTQCHNCLLFGHSATNCGQKYRCLKCMEDHGYKQCSRKSRDDPGSPKCVNCKGDHTANSRICPTYIEYQKKVERQRENRRAAARFDSRSQPLMTRPSRPRQSPSSAWASPNFESLDSFPHLNSAQNNENVSTPRNGRLSQSAGLSGLQARLNAIPDIGKSFKIFESFVARLESATSERERQNILFEHLMNNHAD
jgi:hypothetical protein